MEIIDTVIGLALILFASGLTLIFLLPQKKASGRVQRPLVGVNSFNKSLAKSVEAGTRLHLALGSAEFLSPSIGATFAGLSILERVALVSVLADRLPIASSSNSVISILSQTLFNRALTETSIDINSAPDQGRITGPTPFSYAAGALMVISREQVSTNLFIGHFGPEVALLTDASRKHQAGMLGASDSIIGQSILFATTDETLIGEELFALPAYLNPQNKLNVSIRLQDTLRWLLVIAMIGSSILKFLGIL